MEIDVNYNSIAIFTSQPVVIDKGGKIDVLGTGIKRPDSFKRYLELKLRKLNLKVVVNFMPLTK